MPRVLQDVQIIPLLEPLDTQAGIDSETFQMNKSPEALILLQFGAITADSVLTLYSGATAGAKTTAVPFDYQLSSADYKAAAADGFGAITNDADGVLTLTAATYDHRLLKIWVEAAALAAGHSWVTVEIDGTATVLLMSGLAFLEPYRYSGVTAIPTT